MSGQRDLTVMNLAKFGSAVVHLTPASGCNPVEIKYTPVTLRIVPVGTGSGRVHSASGAIDCTVTNGKPAATGCSNISTLGTTYRVRATPAGGSTFGGYKNVCSSVGADQDCVFSTTGTSPALQVQFDGMPSVPNDTLLLGALWSHTKGIAGAGTVTAGSTTCTTPSPTQNAFCFMLVPRGSSVTVTATASAGATFNGWLQSQCAASVPTCTFVMQGPPAVPGGTVSADALFLPVLTPPTSTITARVAGSGGGSVQSAAPDGQLRCFEDLGSTTNYAGVGGSCTAHYPNGTALTVQALETNYVVVFAGWSGPCTGTNTTCTFTVNGDATITATYSYPTGSGGGSSGGGSSGGGSSGGGTFTWEPNSGTNVAACLTGLQKVTWAQAVWNALPAPFSGLDFKFYWNSNFSDFEIGFRNRFNSRMYLSFEPKANSVPARTTYAESIGAGGTDSGLISVRGAVVGGRACVLVNKVSTVSNLGPYL